MDDHVRDSWERLLDPAELRKNLILASIYITGYEMLKDSIIERIKSFFSTAQYCFDENAAVVDDEYDAEVLSRNRSPLYASLSWLREMNVIDDHDMEMFEAVKKLRNKVVHEMATFITEGDTDDCVAGFVDMAGLLTKIEVWWIKNFELEVNPEFDGQDIEDDAIVPGPVIALRVMTDVALGSDEEAVFYYKELMKRKNKDVL